MRISRLSAAVCALVVLSVALAHAAQQRAGSQPSLKGVWQVVEMTTTGRAGRTFAAQPGFMIFTDKYYSGVVVTSDTPRPLLPPAERVTDKDRLASFGSGFLAFSGPYEVTAPGEFTARDTVHRTPNNMGRPITWTYRFDGPNTLSVTNKMFGNEVAANPNTWKLVRVE